MDEKGLRVSFNIWISTPRNCPIFPVSAILRNSQGEKFEFAPLLADTQHFSARRSTRCAAAVHSAARGRSGAPCSGVHGRRTDSRLVSSVTVAALVCARKTAKSCASSTYVWRSTRRAAAAHSAARGRSGAPCSGVHGRHTERRLVSSVTVAALVCTRKTAKSSASSTYVSTGHRHVYPNPDRYPLMTRPPALVHIIAHPLPCSAPSNSAAMARCRWLCHVSSRFRPIMASQASTV